MIHFGEKPKDYDDLEKIPSETPKSIVELMNQCLSPKPADRPTFAQLMKQIQFVVEQLHQPEVVIGGEGYKI